MRNQCSPYMVLGPFSLAGRNSSFRFSFHAPLLVSLLRKRPETQWNKALPGCPFMVRILYGDVPLDRNDKLVVALEPAPGHGAKTIGLRAARKKNLSCLPPSSFSGSLPLSISLFFSVSLPVFHAPTSFIFLASLEIPACLRTSEANKLRPSFAELGPFVQFFLPNALCVRETQPWLPYWAVVLFRVSTTHRRRASSRRAVGCYILAFLVSAHRYVT